MSTYRGPKPYNCHQVSTIFLRVPQADFSQVRAGRKTEFRVSPGCFPQFFATVFPTPVVAYMRRQSGTYARALMVVTSAWREKLGSISPESLEQEGHESFNHFRRYWMVRERTTFKPQHEVLAVRIRPWDGGKDYIEMGEMILERLYGEFLRDK